MCWFSPPSFFFLLALRLKDNTKGPLYVNDRCIDCTTCANFAPDIFQRGEGHHYVKRQPDEHDELELDKARAALVACPVAAICVEASSSTEEAKLMRNKLRPTTIEFPRDMYHVLESSDANIEQGKVWFVGYHSDKTFGATPYLVKGSSSSGSITVMIDTPKFSKNAVKSVESICGTLGPDYHFITHVDDSAGHDEWKSYYPKMKRIFHNGDLGKYNWRGDVALEDVEVLLKNTGSEFKDETESKLQAWTIDGKPLTPYDMKDELPEFTILHTPGHSPGSISLLWNECILFTGDTLAYSSREKGMSGFPRYGNDLKLQAKTLESLLSFSWQVIAPGHGKFRSYLSGDKSGDELRSKEIKGAAKKLIKYVK